MQSIDETQILVDIEHLGGTGIEELIKSLGELDEESEILVRRTLRRLSAIGVLSIGADSSTLAALQNERNAAVATLLNLLEAKGVDAQHKIESFVTGVLYKAIDVVLGRLGL